MNIMRFSVETEASYQADLGLEKIQTTRKTSLIALALFFVFGFLDVWTIPSALYIAWVIRATILPLTLAVLFFARHEKFFVRNYAAIMTFQYLYFGCAIEVIIYLTNSGEIARITYYAGLLLVIMALYSWTFLPTTLSAAIGMAIVISYGFIAVWHQNIYLPLFMANCLFLISANVIGFISCRERDRYFRENYVLRKSLYRQLNLAEDAKRKSEILALHDTLTGLPNRLYLKQAITEMIEMADEKRSAVAVLFIDIDGFKPINDTYGHEIGDLVLRDLSERLEEYARHGDITGRLGGDEFVVALSVPVKNASINAQMIAERLLRRLNHPVIVRNLKLTVFASIGISFYPYHGVDAEALITMADQQMYSAKRAGKNSVCVGIVESDFG